jgi:hypothetical protein
MYLGGQAQSMTIAVNERLAGLYRSKNVRFLHRWDAFKEQKVLINADGIHFNDPGTGKFSRLTYARLFKSLGNSVKRVKNGNPQRQGRWHER